MAELISKNHNHAYAGSQWYATAKGQTWSRLCRITTSNTVAGYSGLLHVNCTRGNVVCNATFIINISHAAGFSKIVQLNSNAYTTFIIRLVTDDYSSCYIEVYDDAASIASTTTQMWFCSWHPYDTLSTLTPYTSFTSGATLPSGYTVSQSLTTQSGGCVVANKVYGAIWNDYAEYRQAESIEPGRVVIEHENGEMKLSTERLQPGAEIISDTFGFAIGETDTYKTPIAVAGRVLAYPNEDRYSYPLGCAVCSGPNGTVSQMTREEIKEYPERIIGTVSEIPKYETWGTENIKVNGRIWIRIK